MGCFVAFVNIYITLCSHQRKRLKFKVVFYITYFFLLNNCNIKFLSHEYYYFSLAPAIVATS